MDAIFSLPAGPRARVLERAAARIPGCLYICLWAPVMAGQLPSSHLFCVDAWITNDGGVRARAVFDEYQRALCAIVSGCVPGWAYNDGRPYMELSETDLTSSASLPVQLHFYHEAGTKMAVFMGCDSGEIEVGLSSTSAPAVASHVQHSLREELMQAAPTVPSSSSSSLPSISIGSPEYSSFIRSAMATPAAASATTVEPSSQQLHPAVPLPGLPAPVYGQAPFLDPDSEDAAVTQAILAVISSSAALPPASIAVPPASSPWLVRHRPQRSSPRRWRGAFRAYNAALSPRARPRPGAPGQRMIKTAIALMASVQMAMRHRELAEAQQHEDASAAAAAAAAQLPQQMQQQHTSSQIHHMFSERRRRERLNESFQTLRALLPPGTKKDKASVLANTTEYMNKLIAEVKELEERNRRLEAQISLLPTGETQQTTSGGDPPERVAVDVTTGASTSSSTSRQPQEVSIRVTVRAECDLSEVVLAMLARIKEMGRFTVVTVDARQRSSTHAQVGITLRATGGNDELEETSLKEAVAKAVEDAVARPPSPAP